MYDKNDFTAVSKFLKLGVKITFKNPMGQNPSFDTSFPNPKGGMVTIQEKSLYDVERKLRALIGDDTPVKTKLAPFTYLGTNFRGLLYCTRGSNDFIVQETHNAFGVETKRTVRQADEFVLLLS
ncbi:hypothetical protein [Undibacterium rugosum]|uniref:Uncharacterized protein n=1 Tax=Undibacterium rugosum TaxID=2762291 RepID=A0A923KZS5_9BURK|nr:hypothetical protein [Undibacterium rugosum]MBC3936603.1 hypothetical protein [Undibacterium rugosum]MBR7776928.1 hypothetical protein [Undibacterium rugosum]